MAVIIKQVSRTEYSVNGKKVIASINGWHTTDTLNADERKSWINHFKSTVTPIKYNGNE